MIKLFRNNILLQFIIIIVFAVIVWFAAFGNTTMPDSSHYALLYGLIHKMLSPYPMIGSIIATLLILGEGLLFTSILYEHKMIPQNTAMPMLFFVTTMAMGGLALTPMLIVNLILLIIINKLLLRGTLLTVSPDKIFSASAWIAIASMFYTQAVLMLVPLILCFITYKLYNWRCGMMILLGFLAPYIIYIAILLAIGFELNETVFTLTDFYQLAKLSPIAILGILYMIFMIYSVFATLDNQYERVAIYRKNTSVVCILLIGGILISLFQPSVLNICTLFQVFAIPFSYTLSILFINAKGKKWIWEILMAATMIIPLTINILQ